MPSGGNSDAHNLRYPEHHYERELTVHRSRLFYVVRPQTSSTLPELVLSQPLQALPPYQLTVYSHNPRHKAHSSLLTLQPTTRRAPSSVDYRDLARGGELIIVRVLKRRAAQKLTEA